jgi:hypothetical protein
MIDGKLTEAVLRFRHDMEAIGIKVKAVEVATDRDVSAVMWAMSRQDMIAGWQPLGEPVFAEIAGVEFLLPRSPRG